MIRGCRECTTSNGSLLRVEPTDIRINLLSRTTGLEKRCSHRHRKQTKIPFFMKIKCLRKIVLDKVLWFYRIKHIACMGKCKQICAWIIVMKKCVYGGLGVSFSYLTFIFKLEHNASLSTFDKTPFQNHRKLILIWGAVYNGSVDFPLT